MEPRPPVAGKVVNLVFGVLVATAAALAAAPMVGIDVEPPLASPVTQAPSVDISTASAQLAHTPATVAFASSEIEVMALEAMTRIDYPWRSELPDWRIAFVPGEDDVAGYTWSHEQRIEIFVRSTSTPDSLARVLAHELGHAVDVSLNSADDRRRWLDQRDAQAASWWPTSGAADFETGAGDFAETFAFWQIGPGDFRSRVASEPSASDLELLEQLAYD